MDTKTINNLLGKHFLTRQFYLGCYPADKLPRIHQTPASIVINEDESDEPGSHWVGIFVKSKECAYYFDSFGMPPAPLIEKYLKNFPRIVSNRHVFQSPDSTVCGHYVVYFIFMASVGYSMHSIKRNLFANSKHTDDYVVKFVSNNFSK